MIQRCCDQFTRTAIRKLSNTETLQRSTTSLYCRAAGWSLTVVNIIGEFQFAGLTALPNRDHPITAKSVEDDAVLAGGVHALQHYEQRPLMLSVKALL